MTCFDWWSVKGIDVCNFWTEAFKGKCEVYYFPFPSALVTQTFQMVEVHSAGLLREDTTEQGLLSTHDEHVVWAWKETFVVLSLWRLGVGCYFSTTKPILTNRCRIQMHTLPWESHALMTMRSNPGLAVLCGERECGLFISEHPLPSRVPTISGYQ